LTDALAARVLNRSGAQKGEGIEHHLLAAGPALVLIIRGGGSWALDLVIAKKVGAPEPAKAITLA
jgi:uncharacterized membrane protein YphA (DoxX/SURF4 family)